MTQFNELGIEDSILLAVQELGFERPTEIQEKTIPVVLNQTTDLVALAQTGTGKTAAFGLPLLQNVDTKNKKAQSIILSPTRELCLQITSELKSYAKHNPKIKIVAVYGGASINEQAKQIKNGAQIIVATPGRTKDMIQRKLLHIDEIEVCVLDEADEMLNMGFYEDIKSILSHTPDEKSTWLFSATMPKEVAQIAKKFMSKPHEITVGHKNQGASTVAHFYYEVGARQRYQALKRIVDINPGIYAVIFCRTKRDTQKIADKLIEDGYNAGALHGDLSQQQRDLVMNAFRKKQIQILIATDVAARGIDVDNLSHVIQFQLPDDNETYTHRSGRTGRAGNKGESLVIITKSEFNKIRSLEKVIGSKFKSRSIPSGKDICKAQIIHLAKEIEATSVDPEIDSYMEQIKAHLTDLDREELIRKIFSVEFARFNAYYQKEGNELFNSKGSKSSSKDEVRFFINIGEKDGLNWKSLKDYIRDESGLDRDDIFKVDTKSTFSFFNVDTKNRELIFSTIHQNNYKKREVRIEVSSEPSSSRSKSKFSKIGKKKQGKRERKKGGKQKKGDRNFQGFF
ncbi:MAG: ATP-dependent RNA helicase [Flavobacteriaceae bacterium]|nr:ATP-dependent RNA helicase [Flavobacteriaceae bacterium]OUX40536.1 MAG: ATP-dependent RNA helicase [Flavobacteriaceae bacterium TMED265]